MRTFLVLCLLQISLQSLELSIPGTGLQFQSLGFVPSISQPLRAQAQGRGQGRVNTAAPPIHFQSHRFPLGLRTESRRLIPQLQHLSKGSRFSIHEDTTNCVCSAQSAAGGHEPKHSRWTTTLLKKVQHLPSQIKHKIRQGFHSTVTRIRKNDSELPAAIIRRHPEPADKATKEDEATKGENFFFEAAASAGSWLWGGRTTVASDRIPTKPLYGCALVQGQREYMEDVATAHSEIPVVCHPPIVCEPEQTTINTSITDWEHIHHEESSTGSFLHARETTASFFGVFDGHSGVEAANWAKDHLWRYVKAELESGKPATEALRQGFLRTDAEFLEQARANGLKSGAAIVTTLVLGDEVYVASAGDAVAILCNTKGQEPMSLTVQHRPDHPSELERICGLGGRVLNVQGARINGTLSVSRGFGDIALKKWVSPEPDVVRVDRRRGDRYIVLGTDGVSDVLTENEVADIVSSSRNARVAAENIACSALFAGSEDNVGTLVVDLKRLVDHRENVEAVKRRQVNPEDNLGAYI